MKQAEQAIVRALGDLVEREAEKAFYAVPGDAHWKHQTEDVKQAFLDEAAARLVEILALRW